MKKLFLKLEDYGEALFRFLVKIEPAWLKRHPLRFWIPIVVLFGFVLVDNFIPADPRIRLVLTPIEIDTVVTLGSIWFSIAKVKHIVFFFLLYIQLRQIWPRNQEWKPYLFILGASVVIELEQAFIAGREARPLDILPNLIAYILGYLYLKSRDRRGKPISYDQLYRS